MRRSRPTVLLLSTALVTLAGTACGDGDDARDPLAAAVERSRAVVDAEWSYGTDTLPPEPGAEGPRVVDRCQVTFPGDAAGPGRTVDVLCGHLFVGLEPDADSAWIERLTGALDVEVVDRGRLPAWTTVLDRPVDYLLVRVEQGREAGTLRRALASEGVRFVDVREISRRRP